MGVYLHLPSRAQHSVWNIVGAQYMSGTTKKVPEDLEGLASWKTK